MPPTPRRATTHPGNRRAVRTVGGEEVSLQEEIMLTENAQDFERRLAGIYQDWPQFDAWRWDRAATAPAFVVTTSRVLSVEAM